MPLTQVQSGMMDSTAQYYSFKNRIINGAMVIDQRNAGAAVTVADAFVVDRWRIYHQSGSGSKGNSQQNAGSVTPPAGFVNYIGFTTTSAYSVGASDGYGFQQRIEGFNVADLGWGTANAQAVTISFWVRSSLTGSFGGSLTNGSGRSYPFSYTISSANTWEQKTLTVPGDTSGTWPTNNSAAILLTFGLGVGSNYSGTAGAWTASTLWSATGATSVVGTNGATFYITGVQLEKGSTATSFDYRPYGTELALCQRYFRYAGGSAGRATSASAGELAQILIPQMNATPTVALVSGIDAILEPGIAFRTITGVTIVGGAANNNNAVLLGVSGSSSMTTGNVILIPGNNRISLSAEL